MLANLLTLPSTRGVARARHALAALAGACVCSAGAVAADQQDVALYVRDAVLPAMGLPQSFDGFGLWMSDEALPGLGSRSAPTVLRHPHPDVADASLPFARTWVVMLDGAPGANFGHTVHYVLISEDSIGELTGFATPIEATAPPILLSDGGFGPEQAFGCFESIDLGLACDALAEFERPGPSDDDGDEGGAAAEGPCMRVVIISGGGNARQNRDDYKKNIKSMYGTMRGLGVPTSKIWVCYADGGAINVDGKNIVDKSCASKATVRDVVKTQAEAGNKDKDILLIYMTGHGLYKTTGDCDDGFTGQWLWSGADKLAAAHVYTATEMTTDLAGAKAKRVIIIGDQCHSGAFLGVAAGNSVPTAVFTAATLDCPSWGRQYLASWEAHDASKKTPRQMHPASLAGGTNKWPCPCTGGTGATQFQESVAGAGNVLLNTCFSDAIAPNDTCANAKAIGNGAFDFDLNGALTHGPQNANCVDGAQSTLDSDLWYLYTATCDGTFTASTCDGTTFDTTLLLYKGSACPTNASTLITCNDNREGCGNGKQSRVKTCVKTGDKLYIQLAGVNGDIGAGKLTTSCTASLGGDGEVVCVCLGDANGDGLIDGADIAIVLGEWGRTTDAADLDGSGLVDGSDLAMVLGNWGSCSGGAS